MAQEPHKEEGFEETEEALAALLRPFRAFITYFPLRSEVPFREYVRLPEDALEYLIEPRASLDPDVEALRAKNVAGQMKTAVLIPGRRFDATGTRHGQGGGWYDRFLKAVPQEWLRIGFCFDAQFSEMPLRRESWDQAVDTVVVIGAQGTTLHDTRARA